VPVLATPELAIHYRVEGAGPPLIMLHGATSTGDADFAAQLPAVRRAFRVYLPDARGHGGTRWNAAQGLSNEQLVADLEAFADGLGLATFHLLGFSLGGMTALTFATRRPERLRTLVLVGVDVEREPRASVARGLMDPARVERDERDWADELERRHGPGQGAGAWRRLLPAIAEDVAGQPLLTPRDLRRVRVPTLLAYGDRDVFVPAAHAVALYHQLPQARLLIAPGCDHQVMARRPGLFNEAAARFYRETEAIAIGRADGHPAPAPRPRQPGLLQAATDGSAGAPSPLDIAEASFDLRLFDPLWDERTELAEPSGGDTDAMSGRPPGAAGQRPAQPSGGR